MQSDTNRDHAATSSPDSTVLHSNEHGTVCRRALPDGSHVIVKKVVGVQAVRQLGHETALLKRLAHIDGVVQIADVPAEPDSLIMRDEGGVALATQLATRRFEPAQAVDFAQQVARILGEVHKAGVLHKDVCAANLLVHPTTGRATLIDFNIAAELGAQHAEAGAEGGMAGTLAYMSPEQTGRTGRAPDQRSDLYSLGITLYELLTHRKPFESTDLLELVHAHLVQVPDAPAALNPAVPEMLSKLVLRLLEKEPDRRYQSAEGLGQDLSLIADGLKSGNVDAFELGRFDFGARLQAPAELLDRDPQRAALRAAFAAAQAGESPMVIVEGATGTGKRTLIDDFRASIAAARPWIVAVRFDPKLQDTDGSGTDSLQALGRQLLALPDEQLAQYRERLRAGLDGHMGIGAALLPEFQMLLGEHPAAELAPEEAGRRAALATAALIRSIASPERPMVLIFDDVQWAPRSSLKSLDASFLGGDRIPGLMVVCGIDSDVLARNAALSETVARWRQGPLTRPVVELKALDAAAAARFVGRILRLPEAEARRLADALALRAHHNPGRTLSLLNALRDDGLVRQDRGAWHWDAGALRRYVGHSSPDELAQRLASLPVPALELQRVLACLGRPVDESLVRAATGWSHAELTQRLSPAADEGLAIAEGPALRCASDGVREAALAGLEAAARDAIHLGLARRLCNGEDETLRIAAGEQYLQAADAIDDEAECRRAVDLFEAGAQRLRITEPKVAETYLAGACRVLARVLASGAGEADASRLFNLKREHHRALFEQGRLADGDALYDDLVATAADPKLLLEATRVQIYGLMNRRRMPDALGMGLAMLGRLGLQKPESVLPAIGEGIKRTVMWYRGEEKAAEMTKPEVSDPTVVALSMMIPETTNPAYFVDPTIWAWLTLEAHRLWVEHGPSPRLMSSVGALPMLLTGTPQDYRGAYLTSKHILSIGEARKYEPSTSFVRCVAGISSMHWVEPIETIVDGTFRRSRRDLMAIGDESFVSNTFLAADLLVDCGATLELAANEIEEGMAFAAKSKNAEFILRYQSRRHLVKALRGMTRGNGSFTTDDFDEEAYAKSLDPTGPAAATYHIFRALGAAIFGDIPTLTAHAARAVPLTARTPGYYVVAWSRVTQALALAEKARRLPAEERGPAIEEFDVCLKWLTARAGDAPENFLHLQRWIEAERSWAVDSVWVAGAAFEAAVHESLNHARPWHQALIHERAAMFLFSHGMEDAARPLMSHACDTYQAWGASGKVKELRRQHAFLRATSRLNKTGASPSSTVVDNDMVDMMGVLRASQALSSETSLARLTTQVGKVLGAITGATGVYLVVRPDEGSAGWVMANSLSEGQSPLTVEEAGARGEVPLSAFRYAERTKEVLVIEDAPADERFSSDPYVEKFAQCSLLLAPILKQGQLNAMLVLENHQRRNAFRADKLDSVNMIAGQLSVSLDNALLYASLEKRVAERTAQLRQKTNDINAMLQNMPQGVMTVVAGQLIHPEYSAYLATILETDEIANRPVMELLFAGASLGADELSQVDATIGSVIGEDEMNYEFNSHLLATEFDRSSADGRVKSLALSWSPIANEEGTVEKLMICVRDVTELKRLEAEAGARKRELQMIGEIIAVSQEKFHPFVASARAFIDENRRVIESNTEARDESINLLFRNMHTIKGNARTYGLLALTNLVHVAEQSYDDIRTALREGRPDHGNNGDDEPQWNPAKLLAELDAVKELLEVYAHVNDTVLGRKGPGRRGGVEKFAMVERDTVQQAMQLLLAVDQNDIASLRDALHQTGRMLNMIGTEPIKDVLAGTFESLPSLAQELGKQAPTVGIDDRGIVIRTQASSLLKNLFTHLLRNSVDHGIEAPEARVACGKSAAGHIQLELSVDDGRLWIKLRDDGRGLAIAKIRQRAIDQQLIAADSSMSATEAAQLIFHSGFSTAEQVTEVSGRGVGMDAVRGFVEEHGGSIELRFLDDREGADFRAFETVIGLPDKYAASLSAGMSFDTLVARLQASKSAPAGATAE